MATIRAYTNIEQSRKLAEILPLESADFHFSANQSPQGYLEKPIWGNPEYADYNAFPCWSLAALLSVLPNNEHIETAISRGSWKIDPLEYLPNTWWCEYEDTKNQTEFSTFAYNPVDACVETIIKLHEQNLL